MNKWMRQLHRWLSLAFTLAVVGNLAALFVVPRDAPEAAYIGFAALLPLIPLLFTGVYLFALPWLGKSKGSA